MIEPGRHTLPDGRTVEVVEIVGGRLRARVATLGAALLSLEAPDAEGRLGDVTLGHKALADYVADPAYLGVAIGRTAGRVRGAEITVDAETHRLGANDGANTLHGGPAGLHAHVWTVEAVGPDHVTLTLHHRGGGFPGALDVRLRYTLDADTLRLDWTATASAPTPVALTHHAYWNLDGHAAGSVRDHTAEVPADRVLVLADDLTPTGEATPVEGTPFDLRAPTRLGDVLDAKHAQLTVAQGLDHDFVVPPVGIRQTDLRLVARIQATVREMEVWSTEPCVHIYAGGFLDVTDGKGGAYYGPEAGLAVETQPPPDALRLGDCPHVPNIVLRPGDAFRSRTEYRFAPCA